jgi:hypothetical protein
VLDDGTGAVSAALQPLYRLLLDAPNPVSVRCWLYKPNVAPLLGELATGRRPLTHEALHDHPHPKLAGHVRALLITFGLLPAVDKLLLLDFEAWLHRTLTILADHPHERLLRQFGHWHQLPRLWAAAARGPLRPTAQVTACRQFNAAVAFLTWTHDCCGAPRSLRQADIDTWYATHNVAQRQAVRAFWNWATAQRHLPALTLPRMRFNPGRVVTQQHRLDLLHQYLHDEDTPLSTRVAVCLMLLYAQPLTRILRLTLDDLTPGGDGELYIRFGEPPAPVPEPLDRLLLHLAEHREHLGTVADQRNRWLFPGRVAGQPLTRQVLVRRILKLGFPIRETRISALRQLVAQAPAPVIATRSGLPPHHNHPPGRHRRRHLEPLRRRRSCSATVIIRRKALFCLSSLIDSADRHDQGQGYSRRRIDLMDSILVTGDLTSTTAALVSDSRTAASTAAG